MGSRIKIEANQPYIISMPNNPIYDDNYNISGPVRIYAENVTVPVTQEGDVQYSNRHFRTSMQSIPSSSSILNLNNSEYLGGLKPGSAFISGLRDVNPFEAYMTSTSGERVMRIFNDFSQVDLLPALGDDGLTVRTEGRTIIINSIADRTVRIYDLTGRLIKNCYILSGEELRMEDMAKGIYIIEGIKVVI